MKVLAKLGLVTAAAATVLFIFIYDFQGPVINKVMSEPPAPEIDNPTVSTPAEVEEENPVEQLELKAEARIEPEPALDEPATLEPETQEELTVEAPATEPSAPVAEVKPAGPTRRIYGKITLSGTGEQLGGVNIMVPGSAVAKVSNPNGGYTIEIPESTRELVFIYRGKKLSQPLSPDNSLLNVVLNLQTMQYD